MSIYCSSKYHKKCKALYRYCFDYFVWKDNDYKCPCCGEKVSLEDLEDDC